MTNVILVAHILVSIVLVIVVLMQRSEGGALGIGGGGGGAGGGLMSGSGVTGALVRTTIDLNDFDDVLSGDGALLDDPLAVTPSETAPDEAPENDDPLASEADPQ